MSASAKVVVSRERARQDIEAAIDFYLRQGAGTAALDFVEAIENAFGQISRQPGTGSPRYAHELSLPGLRSWRLSRFPYLVFYFERDASIDVWRVLHGQRDIPAETIKP